MPNIADLESELLSIQGQLKRILSGYLLSLFPKLRGTIVGLLNECILIESRINQFKLLPENGERPDITLQTISKDILSVCERSISINNKYKTLLFSSYSLGVIVSVIVLYIIFYSNFNLPKDLESWKISMLDNVINIAKLIFAGIVGSLLYFIGDRMTTFEQFQKTEGALVDKAKFAYARIAIAILIPVALYILFIDGESKMSVKTSPEVISFACGYSYKLGITLCNRVVDKATKLVQALLE